MSYRIFTDSTADLTPQLLAYTGVSVLPLTVHLHGSTYDDKPYGTQLPADVFYQSIRNGALPTTSQIPPQAFQAAFEPVLKAGQDIVYFGFSSALSGTYNAARLVAQELAEQYPQRQIFTVDTRCASMGEGLLVYLAVQKQREGVCAQELAAWAEQKRAHIAHWFTVDDLHHLRRGGRVSGAAAVVGTMLNIKPVLHVSNEGTLVPKEKIRGRRASLDYLVECCKTTSINPAQQPIMISHSDCLPDAEYVANRLRTELNVQEIHIGCIGAVIGSHTGAGTVALFFSAQHRD